MSELSLSAVTIALFLVTPALPFFFWLRVTLPPTRAILGTDFLLILVSCLISLAVNISMFTWLGHDLSLKSDLFTSDPFVREVLASLRVDGAFEPFRPGHSLLEWFLGVSISKSNLISFMADLHVRTFVAGGAVCVAIKALTWIQERYEYLPYSPNAFEKWLAWVFGTAFNDSGSRYIVEKKRYGRLIWLPFYFWFWLADKGRAIFFHPWTTITQYNPQRELLIADVLTKEGSIYSGVLTGWVPGKDDIQSISLQYVLRFLPETEEVAKAEKEKESKKAGVGKTRKKMLIKNNGEMTIPGCELCTVHIWEIRRSFEAEIPVKGWQDLAVVKWYTLIALVNPRFVSKVRLQFAEDLADPAGLFDELYTWLAETKLAEEIDHSEDFFDFIGLEKDLGNPESEQSSADAKTH